LNSKSQAADRKNAFALGPLSAYGLLWNEEVSVKDYQVAMLVSLVAVAWADEQLHARELEVIDALVSAFGLADDEAAQVREYAKTPRSLDDVPVPELSFGDRRVLVLHAVLLSYADGDPATPELRVIDELVERLRIPTEEAAPLLAAAHGRARKLLPMRDDNAGGTASRPGA
jgi:uncharacterized tellurite resistance protein B-like protein